MGAGGNLATDMILRTPADGYTMLVNTTPNIASAPLVNDFDFSRDTAPIGGISSHRPSSGEQNIAAAETKSAISTPTMSVS